MGWHEPFGHLQHKLWQKERSGVKLVVWLPTIKSRESTRPQCVQEECNTSLKRSRWELQLCFRPHPNRRSKQRVIVSQSCENLNRGSFETPPWESQDKKSIWMWVPRGGIENTIWGKVVASPKSGPWWVLWVQSCPWLVVALKVFLKLY